MKRKDKNAVIKEKDKTSKERTGNLDIYKIGIIINLKHLSKEYNQLLLMLLPENARK